MVRRVRQLLVSSHGENRPPFDCTQDTAPSGLCLRRRRSFTPVKSNVQLVGELLIFRMFCGTLFFQTSTGFTVTTSQVTRALEAMIPAIADAPPLRSSATAGCLLHKKSPESLPQQIGFYS